MILDHFSYKNTCFFSFFNDFGSPFMKNTCFSTFHWFWQLWRHGDGLTSGQPPLHAAIVAKTNEALKKHMFWITGIKHRWKNYKQYVFFLYKVIPIIENCKKMCFCMQSGPKGSRRTTVHTTSCVFWAFSLIFDHFLC